MSLYSCEEHKKDYETDCIACEIARHIDDLEAKVKELEAEAELSNKAWDIQRAELERFQARKLEAVVDECFLISKTTEELNMSNYDHDLVNQLNDGMIAVYKLMDKHRSKE